MLLLYMMFTEIIFHILACQINKRISYIIYLKYTEVNIIMGGVYMFSIRKKVIVNEQAIDEFWLWFVENENWIIEEQRTDGHNIICAIDEKLKPVFDGYRKELEFNYGFNKGKGEFFFCDSRNRNLRLCAEKIIAKVPQILKERWVFSIEH